jgi:hypothetical protein
LGIGRLEAGHVDLYEPRTRPERQYKGLRSVFDHDAEVEALPTVYSNSSSHATEQEYDYNGELDREYELDDNLDINL